MSELDKIINELRGKKVAGIYKITNPIGAFYVGESIDLRRRFYLYKKYQCKGQIKLYRSLIKYGSDNHTYETLETINELDKHTRHKILNDREIYWGTLYNVMEPCNLNLRIGIKNGVTSQETKDKISKANKGKVGIPMSDKLKKIISEANINRPSWNKGLTKDTSTIMQAISEKRTGRVMSDDSKKKLSLAQTGRIVSDETRKKLSVSNTGKIASTKTRKKMSLQKKGIKTKPLSQETRDKISKSNTGKVRTVEAKKNMSVSKQGKLKPVDFIGAGSKTILQFTILDVFVTEWTSCLRASKSLNICRQSIVSCLKGKSKHAGHFIWKYK